MDSFEINKILGAVLGTLTFVLGLSIVSEVFFHVPTPEKPGYEIAVAEETHGGGAEPAAAAVEPIAVRLAKADAAKGENVAKRCASCHSFEKGGPNKVGPDLWGVVERDRGAHEGFSYSAGMKAAGGKWTYENLDHFLENPKGVVSGTAMSFAGLKKPEERADIIAYLRTLADSPVPLPEAGAAPAPEAPAGNEGKPQH